MSGVIISVNQIALTVDARPNGWNERQPWRPPARIRGAGISVHGADCFTGNGRMFI